MKSRGKILILDDDPRWQNTLQRFVEKEGYTASVVSDYVAAVNKLQSESFHLAVVDIRLVDWDQDNEEGLQVLAKISELGLDDVVQRIVVTGYGTIERTREAFRKYNVLDFFAKEGDDKKPGFDGVEFIECVNSAFQDKVKLNPNLEIQFVDELTLESMADNLLPELPAGRRQEELTDILNRLLYDMSSAAICPVATSHSGSQLVEVDCYCEERGRVQPMIVKIDRREKIRQEESNFEKYVHGFVGGGRHTDNQRSSYTLHLGAIAYSLLGISGEYLSFGDYYRSHTAEAVVAVLQNLFVETCHHWYANRKPKRRRNISKLYREQLGFTSENLKKALRDLFGKAGEQEKITFTDLDGSFTNPVFDEYVADKSFVLPIFVATTHGDLNSNNILVDDNASTWLIDFYRTGEGHILRDFIELETVIKFELLETADLRALYALENALLAPRDFSESLEFVNGANSEDIVKAFTVVKAIRLLASDTIKPDSDMQTYYVGLFYNTLNLLRFYWLFQREPKVRKRYVLLSAAMLCERLRSW